MRGIKLKPSDIAFSKCIRAANNHTCEKCGAYRPPTGMRGSNGMECSHVFTRTHRTIRWCKDNAQCLCTSCHAWYGGNPADSGVWIEGIRGEGSMAILREKRGSMIKVSKAEEKEIARHYRQELKIIDEKRLQGATGYIDFESWQ